MSSRINVHLPVLSVHSRAVIGDAREDRRHATTSYRAEHGGHVHPAGRPPADGEDGPDPVAGAGRSIDSIGSRGSIRSIGSVGSVLSIGSAGSIVSIGSVGSVLSIGSAGSVLSIGGRGTIGAVGRDRVVRGAATLLAVTAVVTASVGLLR